VKLKKESQFKKKKMKKTGAACQTYRPNHITKITPYKKKIMNLNPQSAKY
jgi:hypothetical protein